MYFNLVQIGGQVCKKPELRYTQKQVPVTNFIVKTVEHWKSKASQDDKQNPKYHKIVVWGNLAKKAVEQLDKNSWVFVVGELTYHKYDQRETVDGKTVSFPVTNTEIKATNLVMMPTEKTLQNSMNFNSSESYQEDEAMNG